MKWFRLYNETIHDRKLRRLPPAQRWLWIAILCAASDSPDRGRLLLSDGEPVTVDDLADMAALPLKTVRDGLAALERLDMVRREEGVIIVSKWDDRQHKSDNSTERWRRWKSQQADNDEPTLDKQDANVGANVGETYPPTATDTDTDTELSIASPNGLAVEESPEPDRKPKRLKRVRPPDPLFNAIAEAWKGEPYHENLLTPPQASLVGMVTAELRAVGATPEEVPGEWRRIRSVFDNPGPRALSAHWKTDVSNGKEPERIRTEDVYPRLA